MITEAELRRRAVAAGVDTMVQDLDYGLGWFLSGLFTQTAAANYLVFKGGTCLRKCLHLRHSSVGGVEVSLELVRQALPAKLAAKGLPPHIVSVASLVQRRPIFEGDWQRRLTHLLPPQQVVTFETAWQGVIELVTALQAPGSSR